MKIYEIGTGYTSIPAQVAAATESVVEELTKAFLNMAQPVEILDISSSNRPVHDLPIVEVEVPSVFTKSDVSLGVVHKMKRVVYSIALASKLKKILKEENEKVVFHFHNQYNLFFFLKIVPEKLRKKAVIAYTNHNGMWSLPWDEVETVLRRRYFQEIEAMKNADLVFTLNEGMRRNVIDHLGVASDKVIRISNGVNTEVYHPLPSEQVDEIKTKYGLNGKNIILQIGSINENKGQERAVKLLEPLLKKDRSLVYAYVGGIVSDEYHTCVRNTAKELGVDSQVVYLGTVSPGKEMNELYNAASATIFLSKYEGFALVCIEALSAGVPVVLCSGTLLNLGDGCIESGPESIGADMSAILYSESNSIKHDARKNAEEHYTWNKVAHDYLAGFNLHTKVHSA
jgi:glycosyltransferase involved in cell wall biosynthesis